MDPVTSALYFSAGAITIAIANELVSRFFSGPRVDMAIEDIAVARTKHRSHRAVPVSDRLRLLLSDGPTSHVDWDARFICEHDIDLSILELYENEQHHSAFKQELERRRPLIAGSTVKDEVLSLGKNQNLLMACVNALIEYASDAPAISDEVRNGPFVFPLVTIDTEKDGRQLQYVHLDLPGNPFPIVGSPAGRPETNKKTEALAYALSKCNVDLLRAVTGLAIRYCNKRLGDFRSLRAEFERIKRETSFLELRLVLANRGKSPAFLSAFGDIQVGSDFAPIRISILPDKPAGEGQDTDWSTVVRDTARRLSDWIPDIRDALRQYDSAAHNVVLNPGESLSLHFVSDDAIPDGVRRNVDVLRTGYADCAISLWQYTPRRSRFLGRAGRFVRRIHSRQRLTGVRT